MAGKDFLRTKSASGFVESMLQSAQENKDVKPQTRFDNVNPTDIEKIMANLKKAQFRK